MLGSKQKEAMEDLVAVKMSEKRERKLRTWEPDEARAHIARFWSQGIASEDPGSGV